MSRFTRSRIVVIALFAAAVCAGGCPARRGGQTGGASGPGAEPAATDARTSDAGAAPDAVASDADNTVDASPDASASERTPDASPAAAELELPPGRILGRHALPDGGPELRVEEVDAGFVLRLAAGKAHEVAVEPIGKLDGHSAGALFLGRGCQRVAAERTKVLAVWTGERERCFTSLEPMAVVVGRPTKPGCSVERVEPGDYRISLFTCGRYSAPLFTVEFEVR